MFVDEAYQRPLDKPRAQRMADAWDRRLLGVVDVSDRGLHAVPRYAVVDGQHRMAAARLTGVQVLAANVHEGLSVPEEAATFDRLNRQRKATTAWDHWRARRLAGDEQVLAIEEVCARYGLKVMMSPNDNVIACIAAVEQIVKLGGISLLSETISILREVWGSQREAYDAPIMRGVSCILHYLAEPIDLCRLADALMDTSPRQLRAHATALKDITSGATHILIAIAVIGIYNKRPGRRLLVSSRTFGGSVKGGHPKRNAAPDLIGFDPQDRARATG